MSRKPGIHVPAPIFNRRRPRQALVAQPNISNAAEEESSVDAEFGHLPDGGDWHATSMRSGYDRAYWSSRVLNNASGQENERVGSSYSYQHPSCTLPGSTGPVRTRGHQSNSPMNPEEGRAYHQLGSGSVQNEFTYSSYTQPASPTSHTGTNQKQTLPGLVTRRQNASDKCSGSAVVQGGRGLWDNSKFGFHSTQCSDAWQKSDYNIDRMAGSTLAGNQTKGTPHRPGSGDSTGNQINKGSTYYNTGQGTSKEYALRNQGTAQESVWSPSVAPLRDADEAVRPEAASGSIDCSLRFITATIQGMKHWSKFAHKSRMLFEIFGILNSAVSSRADSDSVQFVLKDDRDCVTCIFYQIDRQLPRLVRAQWHRCVGTFKDSMKVFHCISVRAAEQAEIKLYKTQVNICDKSLRFLVSKVAET